MAIDETNKRIKIAFLTSFDPRDRRSWSGTVYYLAQALQKYCGDVTYIGPMNIWEKKLGKVINKVTLLLFKKQFAYNHSFLLAKKYAKVAQQRLEGHVYDLIVTVAGAAEIAFLQTNVPLVLIEDATFVLLRNYYPQYSNLLDISVRETNATETIAIQKASLCIYSSEWAAGSAINVYRADAQKVRVVPYGANFEVEPARELVLERRRSAICRLLFVAVNWRRKGGDIAFEALLKLEEMGIQAELTVCGCVPPARFTHKHLKVIPFLDKNDEVQRKKLEQLFMQSDFLLLPTRGDCTPMVFCEAAAFGLPVITTDTGGVSGVITEGENGFMLPMSASGDAYAELIACVYQDDLRYHELIQSSRAVYEKRLNWDAWGKTVKALFAEMLKDEQAIDHQYQR